MIDLVKGIVLVGNSYFKPAELFPGYKVVYSDNGYEFINKLDIDDKIVVVFFDIPPRNVLENIKYSYIIYTEKKPPVWLKKLAKINYGQPAVEAALNRLIGGNSTDIDIEVLKANSYYVHMLIAQNIHKAYRKVPDAYKILDKLVYSPDMYIKVLMFILKKYKPVFNITITYNKEFYGNKHKRRYDI